MRDLVDRNEARSESRFVRPVVFVSSVVRDDRRTRNGFGFHRVWRVGFDCGVMQSMAFSGGAFVGTNGRRVLHDRFGAQFDPESDSAAGDFGIRDAGDLVVLGNFADAK